MVKTNLLFCVKHTYVDAPYRGVTHSHPCYELVYYCEGSGVVCFNKKKYEFEKDTFMICAPNVKHVERGEQGTCVLYIGFELLEGGTLPEGIFKDENFGILEFLEKIYYETKNWSPNANELMEHYVSIIVLKLLNEYKFNKENVVKHSLENISRYISANFKDNINTKELAALAGYSYDHFRKLFYKEYKMTVSEFILKKRIEHANEMLRERKYLIKEIAYDCGFSTVAQFCTKFREITGVTPKQMQLKMLKNEQTIGKDKYSD